MTVAGEKQLVRKGFTELVEEQTGDIGGGSAVAQARAAVEARYIMSERHPRSWQKVEQDLLQECAQPDFAMDKSAIYSKPVGSGEDREMITGLGIRFGEIAIRCMTNMLAEAPIVFEDDERLHRRVVVTDLESNTTFMYDTRIVKTMERRTVHENEKYKIISARPNSEGVTVFTLPISEDALYNKDNSAVSKAIRNGALRILPKHIQKRCYDAIMKVRIDKVTDAPDKAQKAIIDSFASMGVMVSDIEAYLEHPIAQCVPTEIVNLQGLYAGIRDGEIGSWRDVMEHVEDMRKRRPKAKPPAGPAQGVDAEKQRIAEEEKKAKAAAETEAGKKGATTGSKATQTKVPAPGKAPAKAKDTPAESAPAADQAGKAPPAWAEGTGKTAEAPAPDATTAEATISAPESATAEPAAPATTEEEAPAATPPVKPLKIKGVIFHSGDPNEMKRTSEEDGWTAEQYERGKTECVRLSCGFEKTILDWTGLEINDINKATMENVITVLSNHGKK